MLTIEESGFAGAQDTVLKQALDSTGGFNQVVVAAKALVEHGIAMNVVSPSTRALNQLSLYLLVN